MQPQEVNDQYFPIIIMCPLSQQQRLIILRHADSERRSAPRDKAQALHQKRANPLRVSSANPAAAANDHTLAVWQRFNIGDHSAPLPRGLVTRCRAC